MSRFMRVALALPLVLAVAASTQGQRSSAALPASVLQHNSSRIVSFRFAVMIGSVFDPPGKEGLAALTAAILANGGSKTRSYDQVLQELYPLASSINWQVDKEMTVFSGKTDVETLEPYYALFRDMLLDSGFRPEDFKRVRDTAINFLKVNLRENNDEELGKEVLYNTIYAGHPYGHHSTGRIATLEKLTIDDVHEFYRTHYTRTNLVFGLAGGYPEGFVQKAQTDFSRLPAGRPETKHLEMPKLAAGVHVDIVQRDTRSTAISFGFPIAINRASKDWAALYVATSYLGQHRSFTGRLFQRMREARGLNYGDYAYIEYFPRGMYQLIPDANLVRQQQIFQIWVRPVEPQNGLFALRLALYEYDKFVRDGLTRDSFENIRSFLTKYSNVLTQTQDAQLGYALDSRYYGIPDFNEYVRSQLAKLTLDDVNRAIHQYLTTDRMRIVVVTKDAEGLRNAMVNNQSSPITYNSPKPKEILDEDKVVQSYKLTLKPEDVVIVASAKVFM